MKYFSSAETQDLLPWEALIDTLAQAVSDYAAGTIICPERMVLPAANVHAYQMCMPTVAPDLLVTKLLTIFPENAHHARPTIQGQVLCADGQTGTFLFGLDGQMVTMRRTAAMSLLAIRCLHTQTPERVLIIGTGIQAQAHAEALCSLYPDVKIAIRGRTRAAAGKICASLGRQNICVAETPNDTYDVVITVTSSKAVLYDEPARPGCLVIGVGAYRPDMIEIGSRTITGSVIYVDDPVGAPTEAGDIIQAGISWDWVRALAEAQKMPPPSKNSVFFKSVGCGAWDLAAGRLARQQMG